MPDEELVQPENFEVPDEWNFSEKDTPGLKPIIVDKRNRFLAFECPNIPKLNLHSSWEVKYGDYYFGHNGEPRDSRVCMQMSETLDTSVILIRDTKALYYFQEPIKKPESEQNRANLNILCYLPIDPDGEGSALNYSLGRFRYSHDFAGNGISALDIISLGNIFGREQNGEIIKSPDYRLKLFKPTIGVEGDWMLETQEEHTSYTHEQINTHQVIVRNKDEDIFRIDWDTVKQPADRGKFSTNFLMIVTETHLPSGMQKILHSPLRLDMLGILPLIHARPPYEKKSFGKIEIMDVPWLNLDRNIGMEIRYERPLE